MRISADRISGAFFLLFGLAMYFMIIPTYVEFTDEGNIAPSTMPNWISVVIAFCGGVLMLKPTAYETQDIHYFRVTAVYVAILAVGIYAMALFGFEYIAPILALAIMLMIGERRPIWLTAGVLAMPLIIWFLVIHVLSRVLP